MRCAGSHAIKILVCALALSSCTYFQPRTLREISGVILNPDTDRPVASVTLVLRENRHPFLPFPMMTDFAQPIAHVTTDEAGHFSFKVCMTTGTFDLYWEDGGYGPESKNYRENEWSDTDAPSVTAKLFAKAKTSKDRLSTEFWILGEDSSLTRTCAH